MSEKRVVLITGTRKGIGKAVAEHFLMLGDRVVGCSRSACDLNHHLYEHFCLNVSDEEAVGKMLSHLRDSHRRLDILVNNAGIASMNHSLLTPFETARRILETNVAGTFLFCREAAKLMRPSKYGRIINFTTVAVPLRLDGEALYAASKSAVELLTKVLAKEFSPFGITVNAIGPCPVKTDLIQNVPLEKIKRLLKSQAIPEYGTYEDVTHVIDFFTSPSSRMITGQVIYLGGVS